ncbi:permease [Natronincola ferrireducens]|uniref:Predicted permease n=1 Tax=Natronincola ferrireducens TaxID=393762 RepID=A0A1G9FSY2_9FIRM|nr:permease [Natronincola ferrireducens]SDK91518.1 Predicted permease [Natronincola ferrireducens]
MTLLKKYRFFLITVLTMVIIFYINKEMGRKAISVTSYSFKEMILVIPPVFILLGLLDVWVSKETIMKYMGEKSGIKGILLAILLGSAAAGPLYGAFPIAAVFMKKGVKFRNVLIFIGAWSTTKIPMFLFELSALGAKFAVTRLFINIPGIIIIAHILSSLIDEVEIKKIYENAESMQ